MRNRATRPGGTSGLEAAADQIGDRWSLLLVASLLDGPRTFGELQAELGVAPNVLSHRLKHLDSVQVVLATPYSRRPPRFRYELTAGGAELAGALRLLAQWGERASGGEPLHHRVCGTELEARWFCRTCDQVIDDEPDDLRFV
jgi:DNA-binding HxlR family transcriptional regulator